MSDQDQRDAVVASGGACGKQASGVLPKLNPCGDIGLKIGHDGTWFYQGGAIARKGLVKLFASVLRLEDDGGYYLVTPVEKVPVAVETMPFVAVEMSRTGHGKRQSLAFRSNVDDWVIAGPEHALGFQPGAGEEFIPFILVRGGLRARLARPVYYELAGLAVETSPPEAPGVWSCGTFFPFPVMASGG